MRAPAPPLFPRPIQATSARTNPSMANCHTTTCAAVFPHQAKGCHTISAPLMMTLTHSHSVPVCQRDEQLIPCGQHQHPPSRSPWRGCPTYSSSAPDHPVLKSPSASNRWVNGRELAAELRQYAIAGSSSGNQVSQFAAVRLTPPLPVGK